MKLQESPPPQMTITPLPGALHDSLSTDPKSEENIAAMFAAIEELLSK